MSATLSHSNDRETYWATLIIFILVGLVYSNCLPAIWTLDDDPNILQNTRLHIEDLLPETLFQTFFSPLHPDEKGQPGLNRPLAHLSFALNWYFGKDSPAGYRLVNIFIHFLNAFVLFLVIRDLLDTPNMRRKSHGREGSIALIGAALWAVNPIQTQAVVYIVQRMASLACFFYLLAVWCYIQGRASEERRRRTAFFVLTMVSFLAGVGSKENAILLPASLLLLEFTFFQDWSQPAVRRRFSYVLYSGLCMLLIGSWLFSQGKLDGLLGYSIRLFTPLERLLTQPRIVLFYLSQIFYPVPGRLSIVHDVELSRSLIDPWTTLPAILVVLALIGFGVWQMRKRPMLSFAILFFFLNHVVESSFIGLELIYEHRNYMPSLFLFVPLAIGLHALIDHYRIQSPACRSMLILFTILLTIGLGAGTYIRNMAWLDEKTFWEDAAQKAPFSMRPLHNLAYYYYEKRGQYQEAFELYHRALEYQDNNRLILSLPHIKIAEYYERWGAFDKASEHLDEALAIFPGFEQVQYRQALMLFKAGKLERALDSISPLVTKRPNSFDLNFIMAQILIKMGKIEESLRYLGQCINLSPESEKAFLMMGIALNLNKNFQGAEWFLTKVMDRFPDDKLTQLWIIDCKLQISDEAAAGEYTEKFITGMPISQIQTSISNTLDDNFMSDRSKERLSRWILLKADKQANIPDAERYGEGNGQTRSRKSSAEQRPAINALIR